MQFTIKANVLAIHTFASGDRENISCVALEAAREANNGIALATDGHRMMILSFAMDAADYAILKGMGQITIPAESLALALKGRKAQDILAIDTDTGTISAMGASFAYDTTKVSYPDWRQIVPTKAFVPFRACVNGAYVADFAAYLKKWVHAVPSISAHCASNDNMSPVLYQAESSLELYDAGIKRALCLIMPILVGSELPVCAPFDPEVKPQA